MDNKERIFHSIGIFVIGIFIGTALAIAVYLGAVGNDEPKPTRENFRITERESAWVSNVKAW